MPKTAGIILIGNEILSGKIIDANAAYLCRELRELGVEVRRVVVIPDEGALIAEEVAAFSKAFDLVFTSGGVGPTHDDVTIEGVARALRVPVVREPRLVRLLEGYYKGRLNEARLKMAEVRNIYILPGVPEIFRQKFDALKERFRDAPFHLCCVYVSMGEGTLADHLNELLAGHPDLMLGSYPEFSNPAYKVKVTLGSKDRGYLDAAVGTFLGRLPKEAIVRVER